MSQLPGLEHQLAAGKAKIEKNIKIQRLLKNSDFKDLIIDGFCLRECARFLQASTDPRLKPDDQADALGTAQAAGYLIRYLTLCEREADNAQAAMTDLEAAIEEARVEEQNDEVEFLGEPN